MGSIVLPDPPCGSEACAKVLRDLAVAGDRRDVLGMAKGLIMAHRHCSGDEAFDVLRRASQRENVKVWQIADRMVSAAPDGHAG